MSWKNKFKPGQPVVVDGLVFRVAAIGKRSLILHPPFTPMPPEKKRAEAAAIKDAWLRGET